MLSPSGPGVKVPPVALSNSLNVPPRNTRQRKGPMEDREDDLARQGAPRRLGCSAPAEAERQAAEEAAIDRRAEQIRETRARAIAEELRRVRSQEGQP